MPGQNPARGQFLVLTSYRAQTISDKRMCDLVSQDSNLTAMPVHNGMSTDRFAALLSDFDLERTSVDGHNH